MDEIKNIQMKKLFLFAIAGFFFATASNAQVRRDAPASQKVQSDTSHHFRKNMMADLNLTADQKAQLKSRGRLGAAMIVERGALPFCRAPGAEKQ